MNTQHNTEFFQRSIFFVNDWTNSDAPVVEQTTLGSFLREYCEGDPARAWYVKEVTTSKPVWHNDEDGEREDNFRSGSKEQADLPDEYVELTRWEVREGLHSNITRNRLVDSFSTEEEAEEYLLNGLYWNFLNKDTGAPFNAATREECEAEISEKKSIADEKAMGRKL